MYAAVALDHRDSFSRWLSFGSDAVARGQAKSWIMEAASRSADALVIGDKEKPEWPGARDLDCEIWWGAPDCNEDEMERAFAPIGSVAALLKAQGYRGLKLGLAATLPRQWDRVLEGIRSIGKLAEKYDFDLVFEPYFSPQDDLEVRRAVVRRACAVERVVYCKLDVARSSLFDAYTDSSSGAWLARSDGMSFDSFLFAVRVAARAGCSGFMAGSAIWKDILQAAIRQRTPLDGHLIDHRIRLLRAEFGTSGGKYAGWGCQ